MRTLAVAVLAAVGLVPAACGHPAPASGTPTPAPSTVTVFAGASLATVFNSIGSAFDQANPHARAEFNFAGSSTLVAQIQLGAQADVFASADQRNMQKLLDAGLVDGPSRVFATNRLEIIVPAGNPKGITGLPDLTRPGLVVALCAPVVPCGGYAALALQKAGVRVTQASQETDVRGVVSKVALGEADAGIVYATDVKAGGSMVLGISIPDDQNVVARYPIAVLTAAQDRAAAHAFVDFVLSTEAQRILASFGFGGP